MSFGIRVWRGASASHVFLSLGINDWKWEIVLNGSLWQTSGSVLQSFDQNMPILFAWLFVFYWGLYTRKLNKLRAVEQRLKRQQCGNGRNARKFSIAVLPSLFPTRQGPLCWLMRRLFRLVFLSYLWKMVSSWLLGLPLTVTAKLHVLSM